MRDRAQERSRASQADKESELRQRARSPARPLARAPACTRACDSHSLSPNPERLRAPPIRRPAATTHSPPPMRQRLLCLLFSGTQRGRRPWRGGRRCGVLPSRSAARPSEEPALRPTTRRARACADRLSSTPHNPYARDAAPALLRACPCLLCMPAAHTARARVFQSTDTSSSTPPTFVRSVPRRLATHNPQFKTPAPAPAAAAAGSSKGVGVDAFEFEADVSTGMGRRRRGR
jgi:hypothetical protein